jgi:hypothetical protein
MFFYNQSFPLVGNLSSERNHAERRQESFRADPRQSEDESRNDKMQILHFMNEHLVHFSWIIDIPDTFALTLISQIL